jgi:hypothetical protein
MYYSKLLKKQYYLNKIDIIFMNYFIDEKISYNMKNENSNTNTKTYKYINIINLLIIIFNIAQNYHYISISKNCYYIFCFSYIYILFQFLKKLIINHFKNKTKIIFI